MAPASDSAALGEVRGISDIGRKRETGVAMQSAECGKKAGWYSNCNGKSRSFCVGRFPEGYRGTPGAQVGATAAV